MTSEEAKLLARERREARFVTGARPGHETQLAQRLEESLAADAEAGLVETLTFTPDASAFVRGDSTSVYLFERRAQQELVVVSLRAVRLCASERRIEHAREGPIVIERAPKSGTLFRLRAGPRLGERKVVSRLTPPIVLGCERVPGDFSSLDEAFERCALAAQSERWPLPPPEAVRYVGTDAPVLAGDRVQLHRWLRRSLPATVVHVRELSAERPGGNDPVVVRSEHGELYAVGDVSNLRFVARGETEPLPDDEPWAREES